MSHDEWNDEVDDGHRYDKPDPAEHDVDLCMADGGCKKCIAADRADRFAHVEGVLKEVEREVVYVAQQDRAASKNEPLLDACVLLHDALAVMVRLLKEKES